MTKIIIFILCIIMCNSCKSQRHIPIHEIEENHSTLNLLWRLDSNSIILLHTESDFFYKTVLISLSEEESNIEGEVLTRLYLLKGEYGEHPEGILYRVGDFLSPEIKVFDLIDGSITLDLKHIVDRKIKLSFYRLKL